MTVDIQALRQLLAELLGARFSEDRQVAREVTYRVGGRWDMATVVTTTELLAVSEACRVVGAESVFVGAGSNLLIASDAPAAVGIKMHPERGEFASVEFSCDSPEASEDIVGPGPLVRSGAAVMLPRLARAAAERGLGGLDWGAGIPGTVGGSVRMNAGTGSENAEVRHHLIEAVVLNLLSGVSSVRSNAEFEFEYRHSNLGPEEIVVEASFALTESTRALEDERYRSKRDERKQGTHPQETRRTAGSVWRNPRGGSAGALIEATGLLGYSVRGAAVSRTHANFIVTTPEGTPEDVFELMNVVRRSVFHAQGKLLVPETVLIGFPPLWEPSPGELSSEEQN